MRWLAFLLLVGASMARLPAEDPPTTGSPASVGGTGAAPSERPAADVSAEALEDLAATIEDPGRRAELLADIKALIEVRKRPGAAAASAPSGLVGHLGAFFGRLSGDVRRTAVELVDQLGRVPSMTRDFVRRFDDPAFRNHFLANAFKAAMVLMASFLAGLFAWVVARRLRAPLACPTVAASDSVPRIALLGKLWRLAAVTLVHLLPSAAALLAGMGGLTLVALSDEARSVTLALVLALASQGAAVACIEAIFASKMPALRIPPLGDERAAQVSTSLSLLAAFGICGGFALQALRDLGADPVLLTPLRSAYGLILLGCGIVFVLRERIRVRRSLEARLPLPATAEAGALPPAGTLDEGGRGEEPSGDARAADPVGGLRSALVSVLGLWWLAAIIYMVGLYMVWVSGVEGGARFIVVATVKTLAVIGATYIALYLFRRATGWLRSSLAGAFSRLPEIHSRVPQYVNAFAFVLRGAAILLAGCLLLEIWGLLGLDVLASPAVKDIISAVTGILATILLAAATIDVATVFTRRYLDSRERAGRATAQVRTLAPLTQKAIRASVTIVAAVMILGQLGLEIGPILAGIGVLGLAVGFGAQTLVKDIITGVFMLVEGTMAVGDTVRVNDTGGSVEAINLRTIRIRDVAGSVHTIPYSAVTTVVNMSKDFSRVVIDASVAYDADIDEVCAILKEIGDDLRRDPRYASDILEPTEVIGLERFDESAVVIRARLLTKPNQQFRIGREFNLRMKKVFDQRGIEIPFPHRTLIIEGSKDAPPLHRESSEKVVEA